METIKNDEHVFVTAITGGGKTHLMKNYLASRNVVIKLDTKQEALTDIRDGKNPWEQVPLSDLVIITDFEALKKHDFKRKRKVIYVPDFDEIDDKAFYEEFFKWAFRKFQDPNIPFVMWVDELKDVCPSPYYMPRYLKALYTKGRFFKSVVWAASQEPRNMPSLVLSQSTHFFVFDLPRSEDRKRLANDCGTNDFLQLLDKYVFLYFRRGWRNAVKGKIV